MKKKAVILINVGTPDRPEKAAVRRYLSEFLNDPRVIDLPWLARKVLVNLIIIPLRVGKSVKLYRRLWTAEGSPLLLHLESLVRKLNARYGEEHIYFGAMRYGRPSLKKILNTLKEDMPEEIILLPLFPQYASATSGTVLEHAMGVIQGWDVIPAVRFIDQFYADEGFLEAYASRMMEYHPKEFDHVVFSYHGLPNRQVDRVHPGISSQSCGCDREMPDHGRRCYRATCYETTRLLAGRLGLDPGKVITSFQSRLTKNWLSPFSDDVIAGLARQGAGRVLVAAPSFVADCLETTVEISEDYNDLFRRSGGRELVMVESLNDGDRWVEAIGKVVDNHN